MLQKATHIILAFLVLLSSSGLVINQHYCGLELKDTSIFVEAKQCHQEATKTPPCPFHQQKESKKTHKKGCCDEKVQFLKLDLSQQAQSFDFQAITSFLFLGITTSNLDAEIRIPDTRQFFYSIYNPPPLISDIHIELEVFLC